MTLSKFFCPTVRPIKLQGQTRYYRYDGHELIRAKVKNNNTVWYRSRTHYEKSEQPIRFSSLNLCFKYAAMMGKTHLAYMTTPFSNTVFLIEDEYELLAYILSE